MTGDRPAGTLSSRVVAVFVASVFVAALGDFNGFLFPRMLAPAAKGEYKLLTLLPNIVRVLVQFGLPAALAYFAGRPGLLCESWSLRRARSQDACPDAVLSAASFTVTVAFLPVLTRPILRGLEPALILFALCALPVLLLATFTSILAERCDHWARSLAAIADSTARRAGFISGTQPPALSASPGSVRP